MSYHSISKIHPSLLFPHRHDFSTELKSVRAVLPLQTSEGIIEINDYLSLPKTSSVHMCVHLSLDLSLCRLKFKDILLQKWQFFTSPAKQGYQPEQHSHGIQQGPIWAVAAGANAHTEIVSLWNKIRLIWQTMRLLTKVEDILVPIPDRMYFPWLQPNLMLGSNSDITTRSLPPSWLGNIRCLSSPWFLNT